MTAITRQMGNREHQAIHFEIFDGTSGKEEHLQLLETIIASWWWDCDAGDGQHRHLNFAVRMTGRNGCLAVAARKAHSNHSFHAAYHYQ